MKKVITIGTYGLLDLLVAAWLSFAILESSRHHSSLSDQATPFLMLVLLVATPIGLVVAWLTGRGESWSPASRIFIACSKYPLAVIWALLAFVFISFSAGRPD